MSGKCAVGTPLPKRGACPKCGARDNEPCPVAYQQQADELLQLRAENARLLNLVEQLTKAAQDFVDKVDRGEARSKDSYAAFKAALSSTNREETN